MLNTSTRCDLAEKAMHDHPKSRRALQLLSGRSSSSQLANSIGGGSLVHHRTMIAPAIIRASEIDTNIGPTSHSRWSNFRMWGMLTAFLVAGMLMAEVQILDHRQLPDMAVIATADSLSVAMSREIARQGTKAGFMPTSAAKSVGQCS